MVEYVTYCQLRQIQWFQHCFIFLKASAKVFVVMASDTGAGGTKEVALGTVTPASGANEGTNRKRDNRQSQGEGPRKA
jgi:hypothetical protein